MKGILNKNRSFSVTHVEGAKGLLAIDVFEKSRGNGPYFRTFHFPGGLSDYLNETLTGAMTYALRGIYFALFPDAQVSAALTGTAAGLVSVIGYTPDIFMGPLMGYLTDTYPGAQGHAYFFAALAGFAVCGLTATRCFQWVCARKTRQSPSASSAN